MSPAIKEVRSASTETLLKAAYALTHRLHADRDRLDLRIQRDQITAEILRRAEKSQS